MPRRSIRALLRAQKDTTTSVIPVDRKRRRRVKGEPCNSDQGLRWLGKRKRDMFSKKRGEKIEPRILQHSSEC